MPVEQLTDANLGRIKRDLEGSSDDCQSVAALKARVAELEDQLAKAGSADVHGAESERVRIWANKFLADLTKAMAIF
jgi:hypothetical protein